MQIAALQQYLNKSAIFFKQSCTGINVQPALRLIGRSVCCLWYSYIVCVFCLSEQSAVVEYLLSNPEQSCWVLDGYDEFHSKLTRQEGQKELLDPESPLPVADLISGLLNRQLLPGCTIVVTCRPRDVTDLDGIPDKVGQLLGWDCHDIKEYVHNFFGGKGENLIFFQYCNICCSAWRQIYIHLVCGQQLFYFHVCCLFLISIFLIFKFLFKT